MKFPHPFTKAFSIIALCLIFFAACKKNDASGKTKLATDEFIHCKINGSAFNFNMPADSVFTDSIVERPDFFQSIGVYGNRVPTSNMDLCRIGFSKQGISQGSIQELRGFYSPQTNLYPQFSSSPFTINVNITEYGAVNEYVAGNFSGVLIGPPPTNTLYNIDCSFRFRRRL
jgi:hypothetical protein